MKKGVNQNPHHPEELQQNLKEGSQFVEQPFPSGTNSRLGEPMKQELQPLGGKHKVLDQEIESFSFGLNTVLFVIFALDKEIRLYNIEMF